MLIANLQQIIHLLNNARLISRRQWELHGIIYTWNCEVSFDLQALTKYILVQAWNRSVVHSTHWGPSNCLSKSNRQRQSPRRYENNYRKETYIIHWLYSTEHNPCLQGLHGIDIITPGTSTVDHIRDFDTESFGRFQCVSNTASINAFYVSTPFPPIARLLQRNHSGLLCFKPGVGCLFVCIEITQMNTQTWESLQI